MSRRTFVSVLGAAALLVTSVPAASSASAGVPAGGSGANLPTSRVFGSVPVYGVARQVIAVDAGAKAVTFGPRPTIQPTAGATDDAASYSVVSDTCSGVTVPAGRSCTVTVEFRPVAAGLRQAGLRVVATSPAAIRTVALSGTAVPNATGTYYGLSTPTRFLDTRKPGGTPVAGGSTRSVQIAGAAGIPTTGVSAAVVNITAVETTSQGYFTVYPSDKARPTASTVNFPSGWTGANMATVPLGADGRIKLYNYGGTTHAVVDVLGWYAKDDTVRAAKGMGAQFLSTDTGDPQRIYDSRKDPVNSNLPFRGGDYIQFNDSWETAAAATAVKAYAMTVTAVGATSAGVLTTWAGGAAPKPVASTVNYAKGTVAPNMAVVPAGHYAATETGFRILNTGSGSVHIVVDITGYYVADASAGMRFRPLTTAQSPKRILDTRTGVGLSGSFGPGQTRTAPATSVSSADSIYVVGNTTGDKPTQRTYLTIWSGERARPVTSNLNVEAGRTRAVSTYAPLAYNATTKALTYKIFNDAGSMRVIFDAAGTLDLYPGTAVSVASTPSRAAAVADPRTADRTVNGRTVPGARSFADTHQGTTHRRG